MLAKVGPKREPIETPSVCLYYSPLNEKTVLVHESSISFLSVRFVRVVEISLDL